MICAPCGAVIAWTKFDKSESSIQILDFLESVYPTEESRPDYICIDKACAVLHTAITNGSWERVWEKQLSSLLTPTITLNIVQMIFFVTNTVILLH